MKWGQECCPPQTQGEERACISLQRARLSGEHALPGRRVWSWVCVPQQPLSYVTQGYIACPSDAPFLYISYISLP